jgi:D-alanyl-D-alanine dipeptidase
MNLELINLPIVSSTFSVEGESVEIEECNENMTVINNVSQKIDCEGIHYARKRVVDMLLECSELLPSDCMLLIRDAYRTFEEQSKLFKSYCNTLAKQFPQLNNIEIQKMASKYIAIPSRNVKAPSPHTTGGAIDLTVIKDEKKINMGYVCDEFSNSDTTAYYEMAALQRNAFTFDNIHIIVNRRLLYNTMTTVGFTNDPNEWWHYDYGNQNWAKRTGKKAIYGYCNSLI